MPNRLKILLVEDLLFIVDLMLPVLTAHFDVTVAADMTTGRAAMATTHFDLALLDLNLGTPECGVELVPELVAKGTKVIVISAHCTPQLALACLRNGVACFIDKHKMGHNLLEKIRLVLAGHKDFPAEWLATVGAGQQPQLPRLNLTKRKILSALVKDHNLTNNALGDLTSLSRHTIKKAISELILDFNAQNRFDLVLCAKEQGFVAIRVP